MPRCSASTPVGVLEFPRGGTAVLLRGYLSFPVEVILRYWSFPGKVPLRYWNDAGGNAFQSVPSREKGVV